MPVNGYFIDIFAVNGDRTTVPDDLQPGGEVSYEQGYPIGYSTPVVSGGIDVEREKFNQLMYDVTSAIQQYQQHGTPPFITTAMNGGTPYSYSQYNRCILDGVTYISAEDLNEDTPPSSKWRVVNGAQCGSFTASNIAIFADDFGTIKDGGALPTYGTAAGKTASCSSLTYLSSVILPTVAEHVAVFSDVAGTIKDSGQALREPYASFNQTVAQGTEGGTFTTGAWRTRTLNTQVANGISGASLAANQITLPAGTYQIQASAPAGNVNGHIARLYNITDASVAVPGTTGWTNSGINNRSLCNGQFTIASPKVFELQHQCQNTNATSGFGYAANLAGTSEIYSTVEIWKVA